MRQEGDGGAPAVPDGCQPGSHQTSRDPSGHPAPLPAPPPGTFPGGPGASAQPPCAATAGAQPCVVGLALKKDKRKKHISDKLVRMAAEEGITLRFIDKEQPLEEQGPFAAILQKVRKPDWEAALERYAAVHPEVRVFDPPAATYPLRNRGTMVSFLDGGGWLFEEPAALAERGRPPLRCRCDVPTNTVLAEGTTLQQAQRQLAAAGLRFPLLAKPLWADGREGSHALAVVHTPGGLERLVAGEAAHLALPVLLQQYVDHGGCLFKVYVLGDTYVRVKRNSLHLPQWACAPAPCQPQPQREGRPQEAGGGGGGPPEVQAATRGAGAASAAAAASPPTPDLELLDRVSAYPASKSWGKADTAPKGHGVPSPPPWLLQALARRLRAETGLSLFNFDVIVPMHLHHHRPRHASSAAELAPSRGASAGQEADEQQQQRQQQEQQQQGEPCQAQPRAMPQHSGGGCAEGAASEEPVVLDLTVAELQAAAAADERRQQEQRGGGAAASAQAAGWGVLDERQQQEQQGPAAQEEGAGQGELLYHLIDINYFPGYEKMPDYESYMVQFLRNAVLPPGDSQQAEQAERPGERHGLLPQS